MTHTTMHHYYLANIRKKVNLGSGSCEVGQRCQFCFSEGSCLMLWCVSQRRAQLLIGVFFCWGKLSIQRESISFQFLMLLFLFQCIIFIKYFGWYCMEVTKFTTSISKTKRMTSMGFPIHVVYSWCICHQFSTSKLLCVSWSHFCQTFTQ